MLLNLRWVVSLRAEGRAASSLKPCWLCVFPPRLWGSRELVGKISQHLLFHSDWMAQGWQPAAHCHAGKDSLWILRRYKWLRFKGREIPWIRGAAGQDHCALTLGSPWKAHSFISSIPEEELETTPLSHIRVWICSTSAINSGPLWWVISHTIPLK